MLNENIRIMRLNKGFSQEELAAKLHVVRQTISKWEKGLSVPDAEMLIRIAEVFEVPVSELLGKTIESETDSNDVSQSLARIAEQLAVKNRRTRHILKTIAILVIAAIVGYMILIVSNFALFANVRNTETEITETTSIVDHE